MTYCPKCKEEINYLFVHETITGGLSFSLDGYDEEPNERNHELMFLCPECDTELFNNHDDACEFVEQKDIVTEMVAKKVKNETANKPS